MPLLLAFDLVLAFGLMGKPEGGFQVVSMPDPEKAQYLLLLNKMALPRALLFHSWENVDQSVASTKLADGLFNFAQKLIISSTDLPTRVSDSPACSDPT